MGKMGENLSLRNQILAEIEQREEIKRKRLEEKEEAIKEKERQKIIDSFEEELARLLIRGKEYSSHRVYAKNFCRKYFREISKELGFLIEMEYSYGETEYFFVLSVPKIQAKQQTFVQKRLQKFEKDLVKAKEWKRNFSKKECDKILSLIKKGQYKYVFNENADKIIYIETEIEIDEDFIQEFFRKHELYFLKFEEKKLYFKV